MGKTMVSVDHEFVDESLAEGDIAEEAHSSNAVDTGAGPTGEPIVETGVVDELSEQTGSLQTSGLDVEDIVAQLERSRTVIERIEASLTAFHHRASEYEATNRMLHARIEELQQDQVRLLLKPVFERLASLNAQATEVARSNRDADAGSADEFEFFATSINELLALYDIDSIAAAVGQPFDSKVHHAGRIKSTDDPARDGMVQRIHRQGYRLAGSDRVLLPARVSVYRYTGDEVAPQSDDIAP
jgi:molecular chaperone GrpE (heat shock protein)